MCVWAPGVTVGLLASLHAFLFAAAETLVRDAADGFAPAVLMRHLSNGAPAVAIVVAVSAAYAALLTLYLALGRDEDQLGSLLIAAVLTATIYSYLVQLACFLVVRSSQRTLAHPLAPAQLAPAADQSPLGVPGAIVAIVLALVAFGSIIYLCVCAPAHAYGVALVVAVALLWTAGYVFASTRSEESKVVDRQV